MTHSTLVIVTPFIMTLYVTDCVIYSVVKLFIIANFPNMLGCLMFCFLEFITLQKLQINNHLNDEAII